jgi:glycosyltransferase involved in cell wall biosynthesis
VFALVSAFQTEGAPQGEGVPLVVLEAQASGVPAVTSALDGSAESIVDGETGFLVDPGDDAAVAEALRRLMTDAALRARFGAAARALAVGRFSVASFEAQVRGVVASFEGRAPRAVLGAAEEARR